MKITVCIGSSCHIKGSRQVVERLQDLIRENKLDCKIVVGGAVLTADYAENIGADFYAKDAKETVDIAKSIYG